MSDKPSYVMFDKKVSKRLNTMTVNGGLFLYRHVRKGDYYKIKKMIESNYNMKKYTVRTLGGYYYELF